MVGMVLVYIYARKKLFVVRRRSVLPKLEVAQLGAKSVAPGEGRPSRRANTLAPRKGVLLAFPIQSLLLCVLIDGVVPDMTAFS